MSNLNIVAISGNLTAALELRYTPQGTAVLDFTVAVDHGFGEKKETAFLGCTAWGKTAEAMAQHLGKGSRVIVNGRLSQDSWQDRETGKKRVKTKIIANAVEFIGGTHRTDQHAGEQQSRPTPQRQAAPPAPSIAEEEDDIPF